MTARHEGTADGSGPAHPDLSAAPEDEERPGYASFLQLDRLLALQREPRAHDELLFVVVHQAHELWFKHLLHEMTEARDCLADGRLHRATHLLGRAATVWDLLERHWGVVETMRPAGYLAFRDGLTGGSGFESVQYREIEFLAGLGDPAYLDRVRDDPDARARLQRRLTEPSLRDTVLRLVDARGTTLADVFRAEGEGRDDDLLRVCEALLDLDAACARWRARHVLAVERVIGHRPGTGGSSGTAYLRSRVTLRMFPELWDVRTTL